MIRFNRISSFKTLFYNNSNNNNICNVKFRYFLYFLTENKLSIKNNNHYYIRKILLITLINIKASSINTKDNINQYTVANNKTKTKTNENIKEKEKEIEGKLICQDCLNIRHYNKAVTYSKKDDDDDMKKEQSASSLMMTASQAQADERSLRFLRNHNNEVVLIVIDIFDFPNSLIRGLDSLIGRNNRNILIVNKIDLLPPSSTVQSTGRSNLKGWIRSQCSKMGLRNLEDIHLISAKKNIGIKRLLEHISSLRYINSDVYLIGYTNVGKSELINSFLRRITSDKSVGDDEIDNDKEETYRRYKLTSSFIPGTTINML